MKATRCCSLGWLRGLLLASAVLAGAVLVAHGTDPAYASHTEILVSTSNTSPTAITMLTLLVNGPAQTVYVWAKNVDDPEGAAAFEVKFTYNNSLIAITTFDWHTEWLASTGRSVGCPAPFWDTTPPYVRAVPNDPGGLWEGLVSCGTVGAPPPFGPHCSSVPPACNGLLATITIVPGSSVGETRLDLTWGSMLIDTGRVIGSTVIPPAVIPATVRNLTVRVIRCADINGNGYVSLGDILSLAGRFGMTSAHPDWDPIYDLDENGAISLSDVLNGAAQFGRAC